MIVIADDITGAAEIAGIAFEHGQRVRLTCGSPEDCANYASSETIVIATDTRSMTTEAAREETLQIASAIIHHPTVIFKKTDSALRGHVVAELRALMQACGYQRAVYLPANPSKGRIIHNGIYYIHDKPIAETAFSYDPEFPAKTSVLKECFPDAEDNHIIMPDATDIEDIRQAIAQYNDGQTLFAGAADLFTEFLQTTGNTETTIDTKAPEKQAFNTLILCGSTQSRPLDLEIPIAPMPIALYDGDNDISLWNTDSYINGKGLILTIPHRHRTGKATAIHLRTIMAQKAKALVAIHRPDHIIIEGGATAWAVLQALGWTQFEILRQISAGVVSMRADCGTLVTLKPGSYPWGNIF